MTAQRQERNSGRVTKRHRLRPVAIALWAGLGGVAVAAQGCLAVASQAATTERVVVNRYTGLAIDGFDPVAYFVDGRPVIGQEDFEASEAGAVWRFHNEGNRASFVAHPEVYAPMFGGYDPTGVARSVTLAGNPRFWLILGQRLYLFDRAETRDAFAADAPRLLREAVARWPELKQDLAE